MPTSPPVLSAQPVFPALSNRITYNADVYAWASAMRVTFAPELTALAGNVYANAQEVAANTADVLAMEGVVVAAQAIVLAAANFKGTWATRTGAAVVPYSVSHLGGVWLLLSNLADVTAKVPGTAPEWQRIDYMPIEEVNTTSKTAVAGGTYLLLNAGLTTIFMPASPVSGMAPIRVKVGNGRVDNLLNFNGSDHMDVTWATDPTMEIDDALAAVRCEYLVNKWRIFYE